MNAGIFNSLNDLWKRLDWCPICQKTGRIIDVSVGPDDAFRLEGMSKSDDRLVLNCIFRDKHQRLGIDCDIDCNSGLLDFIITEKGFFEEDRHFVGTDKSYFYIEAQCHCDCGRAADYADDIEIDLLRKKVGLIMLEGSVIYLPINDDETYKLDFRYVEEQVQITPYDPICQPSIRLPMFDADFSDHKELIQKLKTYILFQ